MTTARQSRFDSGPHHWHGAQPHRPPVSADGAGFDAGDRAASRLRDFGGVCGGTCSAPF